MRSIVLVVVALAVAPNGYSDTTAFETTLVPPASAKTVARVTRSADFATVELRLNAIGGDSQKVGYLETAIETIQAKATQVAGLSVVERFPSLGVGLSSKKGSAFSSGSYTRADATASTVVVLRDELKGGKDIFDSARKFREFVEALHLSDDVAVTPGNIYLAVQDPENYRPMLLAEIAKNIGLAEKRLGPHLSAVITGLERQVQVRSVSPKNVELFLEYGLLVQAK